MPDNCPRCGDSLEHLRLGETAAVSCRSCGYTGINADHSGESADAESWDEALQRFEANH